MQPDETEKESEEGDAEAPSQISDEHCEPSNVDTIVQENEEVEVEEEVEETVEEKLVRQLSEMTARAKKAEDEIGYKQADLSNQRKQAIKERSELVSYGGFNLSRRLLSVLDDFDRALKSSNNSDAVSMVEGVKMIRSRLWGELTAEGMASISAKGEKFDPHLHEALTTVPADDNKPVGTIIDVLEPGYKFKDRVMRPARVVVATTPTDVSDSSAEE